MQSLRRAIRRGNAILAFSNLTKQIDTVLKRNTPGKYWRGIQKWRVLESEKQYMASIVSPRKVLTRDERGKALKVA